MSEKSWPPALEWPEDDTQGDQRTRFYTELLHRLGPAEWVAVVPTPAPLDAVRRAIEAEFDAKNGQDAQRSVALPYDGVAWLFPWARMPRILPALFLARRPELAFLAFDSCPDAPRIMAALQSSDAAPATRLLLFEDGDLVESTEPSPG